jgi:hypothetical protein
MLALSMLAMGVAALAAPADGALVAHYKLDGDANDATGNGHDGTLSGDASFVSDPAPVPSGSTHSALFNDTDDDGYIELPADEVFIDGSLSIAVWMYLDQRTDSGGGAVLLANAQNASPYQHNYMFRLLGDTHVTNPNKVQFFARDADGNHVGLLDPNIPALNVWYHYAATFDSATGTARLYRDGNEVASGTLPGFSGFAYDASTQAASISDINSDNHGEPDKNFNGRLDDARIYDEALSAGAVKALAVPEPASLALLTVAALWPLARRRRR